MKISRIKIKNMYGITETELGGQNVELSGKNGTGKSSVIDAIRYALTNKSDRDYIVKNGENEGEILIETDDGLYINRKPRTNQADYKSIKKNGTTIQGPENFLRDIFTDLQLSPVEFISWDKNRQNATILDLIEFPWNMETIRKWFGEIPRDVNYEQNILQVLNDIQKDDGYYFRTRQDINRDIRNKRAFIEDIAATIPSGYEVSKWEAANLNDIYTQIERIRKDNSVIEEAKRAFENKDNKIRKFEADREISLAALEREVSGRYSYIDKEIQKLQAMIKALETEKTTLETSKQDRVKLIEAEYKANVSRYEAEVEQYREFATKEPQPTTSLMEAARHTETMKSHINEYKRMTAMQEEVEALRTESEALTAKIELARTLPGEILETAKIPVEGLTVKDGIPLITGLPISNLSDGEKLDLCVDITIAKPTNLQIILIDGVEKLSTTLRERLYTKCKAKGIQFIATRTTDDAELTVTEL